jgi:carbon-monoxide dehydrogenase catalytic subunit
MKLGFCNANVKTGPGLADFLKGDLPPVWHIGECIDNARASALFKALAAEAPADIKDMPYAFASPEWSNEKGIGAALSFRLLGINSYHCVYPPIHGSDNVMEYVLNGGREKFGSRMIIDVDHIALAHKIVDDITRLRKNLAWN